MSKSYKIVAGTSYDERTPDAVIRVLENARLNRTRLHVSLGETEGPNAGRDWMEEWDVIGYVSRSVGPTKVPLLIANSRSTGGGSILDWCIVRIRTSSGGRLLYSHPKYHHGQLEIRKKATPISLPDRRVLAVDVLRDGTTHASFETVEKARRWASGLGVIAPIVA